MEVDTVEQVDETTKFTDDESSENPTEEEPTPDTKPRGRGFRDLGRSGRMGRGASGGRGMIIKRFGQGRGRGHAGFMNGFGPMSRGMGRPQPYPDMRSRKGGRGGPMGMGMGPPRPPPPPMHLRGPYIPMHRHGPPPLPPLGYPGFRGPPLPPRGRGMMPPGSPHHVHPRGYHNGPTPPPPPGRGQRWPRPPGGRRF